MLEALRDSLQHEELLTGASSQQRATHGLAPCGRGSSASIPGYSEASTASGPAFTHCSQADALGTSPWDPPDKDGGCMLPWAGLVRPHVAPRGEGVSQRKGGGWMGEPQTYTWRS